ncbi:hypothetical protein AB0I60_09320 [Actinosynnema sp. NPDC050436]|uniref:hypothetical protein n=1 Tax=Actinosynnema sp. NPDC050436 TaxID=3155659 RepID=UPI0033FC1BD5
MGALVRAVRENPALVRVAAGAVALVVAAVVAVVVTRPDPPGAVALPDPPVVGTYAPAPDLPPATTTPDVPPPPGAVPATPTTTPAPRPTGADRVPSPVALPRTPPGSTPVGTPPPSTTDPTTPKDPTAKESAKWAYARVEPATTPLGVETDLGAEGQWGTPQPITVTRQDVGVYRLRVPGHASDTSVAHTTATADRARPVGCVVRENRPVGSDQVVVVACHDDGTPLDTRFTLVLADPGEDVVVLRPDAPVRRLGPGLYEADLGTSSGVGHAQVTPYGPDLVRCRSGGVTGSVLRVRCTADARWAATYVEGVAPEVPVGAYAQTTGSAPDLRIDPARSHHGPGGAFALHRLGPGRSRVLVEGVDPSGAAALSGATATGSCHTAGFPEPAPTGLWVDVQCVDDAGRAADLHFGIAVYRRPVDPAERLDPPRPPDPGPAQPG